MIHSVPVPGAGPLRLVKEVLNPQVWPPPHSCLREKQPAHLLPTAVWPLCLLPALPSTATGVFAKCMWEMSGAGARPSMESLSFFPEERMEQAHYSPPLSLPTTHRPIYVLYKKVLPPRCLNGGIPTSLPVKHSAGDKRTGNSMWRGGERPGKPHQRSPF